MNEYGEKFDVIVLGGGAAGLSAALWCDDLKLSCLLLEKESELGGQLLRVYNPIENHLGTAARDGRELRDIFLRQTENRRFIKRLTTEVIAVNVEKITAETSDGARFAARAMIVATGVRRRSLGIEGEDYFRGRGIIESGKKDAAAVKNKTVLVVGGGDAALENALILADEAKKVYIAHRRAEFRGREEFSDKIAGHPKIEPLTETVVERISGDQKVEKIELKNRRTNEALTLNADAVLIRIGVAPNTEFLHGKLALDDNGYIKINGSGETSQTKIYAAGDVANPLAPTVSTAVGSGAAAVKAIAAALRLSAHK